MNIPHQQQLLSFPPPKPNSVGHGSYVFSPEQQFPPFLRPFVFHQIFVPQLHPSNLHLDARHTQLSTLMPNALL
jgi:hypothetical protein